MVISVLEAARQIHPADLGLAWDHAPFAAAAGHLLLAEKACMLLLAWYLTVWLTLLSHERKVGRAPNGHKAGAGAAVSEVQPSARTTAASSPALPQNVSGVWIKDRRRSDRMSQVCKLAKINVLLSKAIFLIKGSELNHTPEGLHIKVRMKGGRGERSVRVRPSDYDRVNVSA